jgi:hypothetical protein
MVRLFASRRNAMSEKPLFQDADEQERIYAPDQVPDDERVHAEERGGIVERNRRATTADGAPVPVGGGNMIPAAPASENFEPGMEREARDMDGDADITPDK